MSSTAESATAEKTAHKLPWSLWVRQVRAILRLELRKNFLNRRSILIYLLALLPVFVMLMLVTFARTNIVREEYTDNQGQHVVNVTEVPGPLQDPQEASLVFAGIYEGLILRTVIFFGCAWIFMNLFRGEIVDRSLHYYFLSPVRREVLVAGKYLSGLLTSIILFTLTTAVSLFLLFLARGSASVQYITDGPGLRQIFSYLGITMLACLGYGAVFLFIGLFFRNPIVPALVAYGWEFINFLLPPILKKISVIHYLHSLTPVPINEGPLALVADPTPAWISVPGLLCVTALVLVLASMQVKRTEIRYGGD